MATDKDRDNAKVLAGVKHMLEKYKDNHKEYCRGVVYGMYLGGLLTPAQACETNHWIESSAT